MKLDLYEIAEVLSAKNDVTQFENVVLRNAEFDSRLIESGDLFVPLKGARDGHDFTQQLSLKELLPLYLSVQWQRELISLVDDVLTAFQRLAPGTIWKRCRWMWWQ